MGCYLPVPLLVLLVPLCDVSQAWGTLWGMWITSGGRLTSYTLEWAPSTTSSGDVMDQFQRIRRCSAGKWHKNDVLKESWSFLVRFQCNFAKVTFEPILHCNCLATPKAYGNRSCGCGSLSTWWNLYTREWAVCGGFCPVIIP
jgi:hypothetical protein